MVSLNLNMAALVTFLDIAQFLLGLVDLRLLANDGRFEAAATLLGTESSSDSDSKRNDGGHDSFGKVSILLQHAPR
jgi:hypothetical protein